MKSLAASSLLAFWSYTRTDDRFLGGALTRLRERLEMGVRVFTGEPRFQILQDVGICPGDDGPCILQEMLAQARILIPVVTPLYLRSGECRHELETFISLKREAEQDGLILPIYFVTAPALERPPLLPEDPFIAELRRRQRFDWRPLADLPRSDPRVRCGLRTLCVQIGASLRPDLLEA